MAGRRRRDSRNYWPSGQGVLPFHRMAVGYPGPQSARISKGSELIRMGNGRMEFASARRCFRKEPLPGFDPSLLCLDQQGPDPLADGRRNVRVLVSPSEAFPMPLAISDPPRPPGGPWVMRNRIGRSDNRVMPHESGIDPFVMFSGNGEPCSLPLTHDPTYTPAEPGRAPKKGRPQNDLLAALVRACRSYRLQRMRDVGGPQPPMS